MFSCVAIETNSRVDTMSRKGNKNTLAGLLKSLGRIFIMENSIFEHDRNPPRDVRTVRFNSSTLITPIVVTMLPLLRNSYHVRHLTRR